MDSCFWRKGQEIHDKLPSKLFVYLSTKKGRFIILTPLNKYFNKVPITFCCLHEYERKNREMFFSYGINS